VLVRSGLGRAAMEQAIGYLRERYRPEFVLHVGYCGGAEPTLQPGDMVVARPVIDSASGERFEPDDAAAARACGILKGEGVRFREAGIVTVDAVARQPFDKAFLGTQHGAVAIDMESSALASICQRLGTPYVVVRAVLDPLDYEFPDMEGAVDEAGKTDGMAIAGHLIRRPQDIIKLPRIEYFATQARQSMNCLVEGWLEEGAS
jgi:adenosylhomocysteine nucleosidase